MADDIEIPEASALGLILSALVGKDIVMEDDAAAGAAEAISGQLAVFVDDTDSPVMLAGGDREFAYFSGAALAMIPKGRAEDALIESDLDADLMENYAEILNVVTRTVNDAGGPHVRLVPGSRPDLDDLPEPHSGRCFEISIDGYGTGHLSFWKL